MPNYYFINQPLSTISFKRIFTNNNIISNIIMHRGSCHSCGYYREEKRPNGTIRCYCNDRDCTVDPYEPACNYND